MRYVLGAVAFLLFSAEAYAQCPCPCQCQQRQYQRQNDDGWDPPQHGRRPQSARDVTRIEGGITPATLDRFVPAKIVILDSPGGRIEPAIEIGEMIRQAGSTTVVPYGARCESACAIIWVAAEHRLMAGKVGFHAPHDETPSGMRPAPEAEEMIAHAYQRWGLSREFTEWSMHADPNDIAYLTPGLARRFGIKLDTNIQQEKPVASESRSVASSTNTQAILNDIRTRLDRMIAEATSQN